MSPLSPQLFAILSTLVEERTGLHYAPADATVFSEKVLARMTEAGFQSALDYYYYLRYDAAGGAEMDALIDALVVGETYFFRELEPLRVAVDEILLPAIERNGSARVWSAACATGEEASTLAMLAAHAGILSSCRIVASDISERALARARAGDYRSRSLRALADRHPPIVTALAARFIEPTEGGGARLARSIVDAIEYRRVNLVDRSAVRAFGAFDLVLCRNVLIYFSDATVVEVVSTLRDALTPSGRLLVGASESLMRFGTLLECEERAGVFFYRRAS